MIHESYSTNPFPVKQIVSNIVDNIRPNQFIDVPGTLPVKPKAPPPPPVSEAVSPPPSSPQAALKLQVSEAVSPPPSSPQAATPGSFHPHQQGARKTTQPPPGVVNMENLPPPPETEWSEFASKIEKKKARKEKWTAKHELTNQEEKLLQAQIRRDPEGRKGVIKVEEYTPQQKANLQKDFNCPSFPSKLNAFRSLQAGVINRGYYTSYSLRKAFGLSSKHVLFPKADPACNQKGDFAHFSVAGTFEDPGRVRSFFKAYDNPPGAGVDISKLIQVTQMDGSNNRATKYFLFCGIAAHPEGKRGTDTVTKNGYVPCHPV